MTEWGQSRTQDTLVGLSVQGAQGGQQFSELANPSTLPREKAESATRCTAVIVVSEW